MGSYDGQRQTRRPSTHASGCRAPATRRSSRVPAATRSPSWRPRRRTACRIWSPCATSGWPIALRLLPRHAGGHGLRPGRDAADRHPRSRPAATPTSRTSGSSPRPSGRSSSMPTTSTRRCPAPWEWDVKRLAASVIIAGRANGFSAAAEPRRRRWRRAQLPPVDGSLRRHAPDRRLVRLITEADIREVAEAIWRPPESVAARRERGLRPCSAKARGSDGMRAFESLTAVVDGRRVIMEDPPVVHAHRADRRPSRLREGLRPTIARRCPRTAATSSSATASSTWRSKSSAWAASAPAASSSSCRAATRTTRSSCRPRRRPHRCSSRTCRPSLHENHGQRVVVGQQLMQATSDIFLGWTRGPGGRDFYLRQLWDMKGSVDTTTLLPVAGPGVLRRALRLGPGRAHARSGDAVAISAYLGNERRFDGAIADFAETYADINARTTPRTWPRSRPGGSAPSPNEPAWLPASQSFGSTATPISSSILVATLLALLIMVLGYRRSTQPVRR